MIFLTLKLAIVANDLIGDAFGVKAFHRCQVNNLLRSQLIPVNPTKQNSDSDIDSQMFDYE